MHVRDAVEADLAMVNDLYNALVTTTTVAWTEEAETLAERTAWFLHQQELGYPLLVAQVGDEVVGFAAFSDFRDSVKWPGYRYVVEHTIHVRDAEWGQGIGRALIVELLERARLLGKTQMVAGIDGANDASIRFHERLGFVEVARMPQIGRKFGEWLDLVLMQRSTDLEES